MQALRAYSSKLGWIWLLVPQDYEENAAQAFRTAKMKLDFRLRCSRRQVIPAESIPDDGRPVIDIMSLAAW
jgi:hypothetical protein